LIFDVLMKLNVDFLCPIINDIDKTPITSRICVTNSNLGMLSRSPFTRTDAPL